MSSAQLTLWSQDSPVSRPRTRVSAVVQVMIVGSGRTYTGSFDAHGPLGYCLRTFLDSSRWDSIPFSAIWQARATKQRRVFIRLQRLERHTNASASSLSDIWPTPTVNGNNNRTGASPTSGDGLATIVKMWPTPTSTAGDGRSEQSVETWMARRERTLAEKGIRNGLPLNVAVQMWPTPQARAFRSGDKPDSPRAKRKRAQGWSQNLNDVAGLWSTPAAQDSKNATLPVSQATRDTLPGDLLRQGNSGKLNPAWVSQLMGFPDGWLDIPAGPVAPAKRSTSGKRRALSRPATARRNATQS